MSATAISFGKWLQETRLRHGLDLDTLARRSGVDRSSINRVEREVSQPTLHTAVRLCTGLEIGSDELVWALQGRELPSATRRDNPQDSAVLTMEDLCLFIEVLRQDPARAHDLLATWVNLVSDLYSISKERTHPRSNGESPPVLQFSQSDVDKLLSDVAFYRSEILFPLELDGGSVLELYWQGGVITLRDVGAYVRWLRSTQDKALTDLHNSIALSESALSRLETGQLEQVRMKDVLNLDQELCREGELVRMSWEACAFYPGSVRQRGRHKQFERTNSTWSEKELRLVLAVIAVVRWWSYFDPSDQTHINELRQSLQSALAPQVEPQVIAG